MANAALDKNEYEMPKVNIGNLAYESKVTKHVLNMIRPLHPEYSSDDITRAVKEIFLKKAVDSDVLMRLLEKLLMFLLKIHVQRRKRLFQKANIYRRRSVITSR